MYKVFYLDYTECKLHGVWEGIAKAMRSAEMCDAASYELISSFDIIPGEYIDTPIDDMIELFTDMIDGIKKTAALEAQVPNYQQSLCWWIPQVEASWKYHHQVLFICKTDFFNRWKLERIDLVQCRSAGNTPVGLTGYGVAAPMASRYDRSMMGMLSKLRKPLADFTHVWTDPEFMQLVNSNSASASLLELEAIFSIKLPKA